MHTDSFGTPLPRSVGTSKDDEYEELIRALVVNSFILACRVSLSVGDTVAYDPETKTATITDKNGFVDVVNH